jgi:hypothetical protein
LRQRVLHAALAIYSRRASSLAETWPGREIPILQL